MIANRFWSKVNKAGPIPAYRPDLGPCWLWVAGTNRKGYGQFWGSRHPVLAHRFAYEILVGPIPLGMTLDHLCRVRHCVNAGHLEPVPNGVNILRGTGIAVLNSKKTHCPQKHPYDAKNTLLYQGRRYCRACKRAWHARFDNRLKRQKVAAQ